jgi:hypothetical protein
MKPLDYSIFPVSTIWSSIKDSFKNIANSASSWFSSKLGFEAAPSSSRKLLGTTNVTVQM